MPSRDMAKLSFRIPGLNEPQILERVKVRLLDPDGEDRTRYRELMERHHYLKSDVLVGEQLRYVGTVWRIDRMEFDRTR